MPIRIKHTAISIAVGSAAMTCSTLVGAQEQYLEEVVVTAQKREQSASDIPIAISVLDGDELADKGIQDFGDLSVSTSSLDVARGNSTNNPVITIRGVGSTDPWINNNPSVSAFSDGVYLPFASYLSMPLYDLERVEILKGPQAGLYGRNSIAGAINFISARPGDEFGGYLDTSYGAYGEQQLQAAVDTPVSETLLLRLATTVQRGGGYIDREGTADTTGGFTRAPGVIPGVDVTSDESGYGDKDIFAVRATALWLPTDNISVNSKIHYASDESEIINSTNLSGDILGLFQPAGDDPFTDYDDFAGRMDASQKGASVEVNWDLDSFTFTSLTGVEKLSRQYGVGDFTPLRLAEPTYDERVSSVSQEFRIAADTDSVHWLAGVNATADKIDYGRVLSSADFLMGDLVSAYEQEDKSWSLFGQVDWLFADDWELSSGLRYTDEQKDYEGGSYEGDPFGTSIVSIAFPGVAGGLWGTSAYDNQDVSGQLKLSWTGIDDTLVYASVSRGFKSGGFDGSGLVNEAGYIPYGAEQLIAYETGIKTLLLADSLELSASAFFYDYSDKQVLAILDLGNGITEAVTQNAAASDVTGLDLELKYHATENLSFGLAATLLDSEITDWDSDDPAEVEARTGNELPGTPENSITGDVNWSTEVSGYGIDSRLWVVHSDAVFRDIENTPDLMSDGYTLLNARVDVGRAEGDWSVYMFGKNLTDETYVTSVRTLLGMEGAYYGEPRTWGAGFRWNF
ncbi:TonB-dependent receptor [Microbulbifer sp. TYP-18]|uniref:TonB-dependent receptor n=1 Tax=Microbulbifer sp. TYP-18 TaxID=3230024 RepID=UPI0034C5B313